MILRCGNCARNYEASMLEPGETTRCACGDLLIVPDPEQLEAPLVIPEYLSRWAEDYGTTAEALKREGGWEFIAGSALVRVEHDAAEGTIAVESALFPAPQGAEKRLALFARLLELNRRRTGEARFALHEGHVVVTFSRPTLGLDYLEFQRAVEEVARAADDYDDELQAEFSEQDGGDAEDA